MGDILLSSSPKGVEEAVAGQKPTLFEVENAFQPAKEVGDIDRFAGRSKPVTNAFLALMAEGANLAIVGNRGIGKTSLARQIENFGRGDNALLDRLRVSFDHKHDYNVIYLACGNEIANREDLLTRLLTSDACLGTWLYDIPKTKKMMHSLSPKLSARLGGGIAQIGGEIGNSHAVETVVEQVAVPQTIEGIFENVVRNLVDENLTRDGILIVVDEFDQIADPSGIGPFLKALSTNVKRLKFCIVGVATDIQQLMKEHESSDRLFAGTIIALDPMSGNELNELYRLLSLK